MGEQPAHGWGGEGAVTFLSWRVYYSDGSTFSNVQDRRPEKAPAYGVICIVSPNDLIGREILHGHNFYYWIPPVNGIAGYWSGGDRRGVFDRLLSRLPLMALLEGRNVQRKVFLNIMSVADKDKDFPPTSGKFKRDKC